MSKKREFIKRSAYTLSEDGQAVRGAGAVSARARRSYALLWRQTLVGIGGGICAFFLGRCVLLFGARPLGIALLCAATHAIPYLYGGLILSALTAESGTWILCGTYTAALVIRVLSRSAIELPGAGRPPAAVDGTVPAEEREEITDEPSLRPTWAGLLTALRARGQRVGALLTHWFSESIYLRMMTACVCAFLVSLYTIIDGGFRYYDLFGAFFAMATAPIATYLYAGIFSAGGTASPERRLGRLTERQLRRAVAEGALLFSLLYAMRDISVLSVSATAFFGFLLTLAVTRREGLIRGMLCGILCGLAYSPVITPSFVLAAPVFGLLRRFSAPPAALAACLVGVAWGFYPLGFEALTLLLPPFLAAALLTCAFDRLLAHPTLLWESVPNTEYLEAVERAEVDRRRVEQAERRMQEISSAFSSLADVFFGLSDRLRRPGLLDLRRMCDRAFDSICPDCPQRDLCWGADYAGTMTQLSRMAAALHERGRVEETAVDESFRSRCPSLPALTYKMNLECARMTEAALRTEKTEVFAMDYDGLSQILADALEEQNAEFLYDEELSERVRRALYDMELHAEGVLVWGKRQKQIVARGVDASASSLGAAQIHRKLEEACGVALGEIFFDLSDTGVTLRVSTRPRLAVRRTVRTQAAESGICGDTVCVFDTDRDRTYALISDGMGSGQEAAFTSGLCSLFLEKMLLAGNRPDTALRMLNSMMRQKGGGIGMECSATVDLLELDLLTGKASILKSGASPTYVRRDDCLFKLHAKTAPIGILREVDAQRLSYDVLPGDVIIMLSDGVDTETEAETDCEAECLWLLDLLSDGWQSDPDAMSEAILSRARKEGSRDDLSVILLEVLEG